MMAHVTEAQRRASEPEQKNDYQLIGESERAGQTIVVGVARVLRRLLFIILALASFALFWVMLTLIGVV